MRLLRLVYAYVKDLLYFNTPRYLLIDEIDKMTSKNQTFLLDLMEIGIISETKYIRPGRHVIGSSCCLWLQG
jgi:MoxR-like ATPase